jgi:transcriptional regulator with XRE-family HTH domain
MKTIGQKIYERRKAKGLTQEVLAEISKVNLRTIQRIENNENIPRESTLSILCDALELNIEDLQKSEAPVEVKKSGSLIIHGVFLYV